MSLRHSLACLLFALVTTGAPASPADDQLLVILDQDFKAQLKQDPLDASRRGYREFDRVMPDLSAAARAAWVQDARDRLAALESVDPSALTASNKTNLALLRYELKLRIDAERFNGWQMPVTQQNGPQNSLPQLPDFLSFSGAEQLEDYVARLEAVPAYLDQTIENMREGMRSGRTPPRVVMGTVPAQAASQAEDRFLTDPAAHAMYKPLSGQTGELAERGKRAIKEAVVPAFKRFAEFLEKEYVPACRPTIACRDLPDGEAFYNFRLRAMTTLDLTAEQIHQLGMTEVARIRNEMFEVIARSDFAQKDSLKGEELFNAFVHYLRTDPRFYYTSADDLMAGYQRIAKRIDPEMSRLFRTLPRLSYGVREMPRFIAPSAPTAYYYPGSLENGVPGWFIANTYLLDQRPKYEMISLTLHEAVPGHHHQYSIAQELKSAGLPEWRTTVDYTVFGEGWGLYSERLGLEMGDDARSPSNPKGKGLFTDPYDDFGRLSYEMWRAMRLVVDTGMHALGWSRDKAIQFMLDNSALTKANIEREVDRYIAWPGQAVAYKIGELRIRDLRSKAEEELGDRFDVRGFHDAVLMQGAVPAAVLDAQVKAWVEERKRGG
ncbi:MAG: DUF885 domain-containing protein [Phycisphaerae bacterium]|nr:DUF885 domain-containing protein [Phycisphaerae bacterium]